VGGHTHTTTIPCLQREGAAKGLCPFTHSNDTEPARRSRAVSRDAPIDSLTIIIDRQIEPAVVL
jgi:hypothetical protein